MSAQLPHNGESLSSGMANCRTTVLIVGAGSTGLALAQGLTKAGIACIVAEKHANLHMYARDWNMGLFWGVDAFRSLLPDGAWERIQSVQVDPNTPTAAEDWLKVINAQSGDQIAALRIPFFYRLRRSKLRQFLADGLDIRYGKKLTAIEFAPGGGQASAVFADRSRIASSLIVGADGAHSTVRQLLLGPVLSAPQRLPYCATFVQARFSREQALFLRGFQPLYLSGISPTNRYAFFGMHDVADPERPETWTFFFYISWESPMAEQDLTAHWSNSQRLQQVKTYAQELTNPWRSAAVWLPDGHPVWYMGLTNFDPGAKGHRWDSHGGRVTLAGDAAHAMTYQRGQGLNHSITDAANLCRAMTDVATGTIVQAAAIRAYEDEMIQRAGDEVRTSAQNTAMLHDWESARGSPIVRTGLQPNPEVMTE
ncbi:hypothetical protein AOCH_001825 [Aspergillus ochraceoroseus]|uniref:FAD-binding domain-containing protein n=2 Tax=Aspergillus ochraceoroseus TaxID=138278 RepID=A0A0F8X5N6_9EURO|nr:hypothetical protein AOCH_001825 [Aspergillus ochraceoroseus]